jgi:hypothetical protein
LAAQLLSPASCLVCLVLRLPRARPRRWARRARIGVIRRPTRAILGRCLL